MRTNGIENFLGIPYAKPPVGSRRWAPPQPAAPWSGVRSGATYGSYCPQPRGLRSPTIVVDEDCLFINVQRPVGLTAGAKRPVFVYIHGGGFAFGSSARDGQDLLVQRDGIIGVTMNYRLGALGFLAVPGLTAESGAAGDFGLLDQQLALRWVRDNIAAFGGDPSRVTIGGESAGGWSVCDHLVAPGSRDLFVRAISQSGSCFSRSLSRAEADGEDFARTLGCADRAGMVACLRGKQVVELLDHQATGYFPTHGNSVLPEAPRVAVAEGRFAHVPELIGSNLDEQRSFTMGAVGWSAAKYVADIRRRFGQDADRVLAAYPAPSGTSPQAIAYQLAAVNTDAGLTGSDNIEWGIGGCGAAWLRQTLAHQVPVYAYEFAYRDGPGWYPIANYVWGAGHAADLVYLYPNHDGGIVYAHFSPGEHQLSDELGALLGRLHHDRTTRRRRAEILARVQRQPWPPVADDRPADGRDGDHVRVGASLRRLERDDWRYRAALTRMPVPRSTRRHPGTAFRDVAWRERRVASSGFHIGRSAQERRPYSRFVCRRRIASASMPSVVISLTTMTSNSTNRHPS